MFQGFFTLFPLTFSFYVNYDFYGLRLLKITVVDLKAEAWSSGHHTGLRSGRSRVRISVSLFLLFEFRLQSIKQSVGVSLRMGAIRRRDGSVGWKRTKAGAANRRRQTGRRIRNGYEKGAGSDSQSD